MTNECNERIKNCLETINELEEAIANCDDEDIKLVLEENKTKLEYEIDNFNYIIKEMKDGL